MNKDIPQIGFAIQSIKTEQFAMLEGNYQANAESSLSTKLQFKIDERSKHIGVFVEFEFAQEQKVFLKIEISCHFKIQPKSWTLFKTNESSKLKVSKGFLAHLAMITTGTSRGILFAKTEGTSFSKFIIPTLNVAQMIPEDVTFTIASE